MTRPSVPDLMRRAQRGIVLVSAAGVLAVAGCSSSGGSSGVSTSDLVAKLKQDSNIKQLESQSGAAKKATDALVTCIASALKKDADPGDLKKYVDGKLDLSDLGGKEKGSAQKAEDDAKSCAQQKLSNVSGSASG